MFSLNSKYLLPCGGALSAHINDDHDHIFSYNAYQKDELR